MMKMLLVFVALVSVSWGESISLGETVHGSWTEDSPKGGETHRAKAYYTFTLNQDTRVSITLRSEISTRLRLFNTNNTVLDANIAMNHGDDRLVHTLQSGTYTIDVTTWSGEEFGDFTLSLVEVKPKVSQKIELDTVLEGTIDSQTGLSQDNAKPAKYYTFSIDNKKRIEINFESDIFSELKLKNSKGEMIDYIYPTQHIIKELDKGRYEIGVESYKEEFGNFIFSVNMLDEIKPYEIALGSTINNGVLEIVETTDEPQQYVQKCIFTLSKKTNIMIKSDTQFFLEDSNHNKDGYSFVSGITLSDISHKLYVTLEPGSYSINLNGYSSDFSLLLKEVEMIESPVHSITNLNTIIDGAWTDLSKKLPSSYEDGFSLGEYYTFTLTESTKVDISLEDAQTTGTLELFDNGGKRVTPLGENIDNIDQVLEAGIYRLGAVTIHHYMKDFYETGTFKINFKSFGMSSVLVPVYGLLLQ